MKMTNLRVKHTVLKGTDYLKYPTPMQWQQRFVLLFSSMRAGSTLLKSLLPLEPDVSHLSEVKLRKYRACNKWDFFSHFNQHFDYIA